ncbi:hypothetical protein [Streptomyces sp. NPDC060333]|uniref:hypothetical protein n=1 Tax=Streptomyces sp. NPDC060333 TaxID=3347098 RepID=UPI003664F91B
MTEYGFIRAPDEVISIRVELAEQVVKALQDAGLPAFRDMGSDGPDQAGAVVYVEPDAELGSAAVSVGWRCGTAKLQVALDALAAGTSDGSALRYLGMVSLPMQNTMIKILLSAGIIATLNNDTMNPEHVLVFGMTSDLPPAVRPA